MWNSTARSCYTVWDIPRASRMRRRTVIKLVRFSFALYQPLRWRPSGFEMLQEETTLRFSNVVRSPRMPAVGGGVCCAGECVYRIQAMIYEDGHNTIGFGSNLIASDFEDVLLSRPMTGLSYSARPFTFAVFSVLAPFPALGPRGRDWSLGMYTVSGQWRLQSRIRR